MGLKLFISMMMFVLSAMTYAQSFSIPNKYIGDPLIQSEELFLRIEENCSSFNDDGEYSPSERKNCPLDKLSFDFGSVYTVIESKHPILNSGEYQFILTKKNVGYYFYDDQYIGSELLLSLIYKDGIRDTIVLATSYTNETSFASVGDQYYYMSNQGDIYTLQFITTDDGASPLLWKHYWVDTNNTQFAIQKMLVKRIGILYQITYPDQLEISRLPTPYAPNIHKTPETFNLCLNDITDNYCAVDAYIYYSNQLKENTPIKEYTEIEKRINSVCLKSQSPSHFNEVDGYISSLMTCLIEQSKQSLK